MAAEALDLDLLELAYHGPTDSFLDEVAPELSSLQSQDKTGHPMRLSTDLESLLVDGWLRTHYADVAAPSELLNWLFTILPVVNQQASQAVYRLFEGLLASKPGHDGTAPTWRPSLVMVLRSLQALGVDVGVLLKDACDASQLGQTLPGLHVSTHVELTTQITIDDLSPDVDYDPVVAKRMYSLAAVLDVYTLSLMKSTDSLPFEEVKLAVFAMLRLALDHRTLAISSSISSVIGALLNKLPAEGIHQQIVELANCLKQVHSHHDNCLFAIRTLPSTPRSRQLQVALAARWCRDFIIVELTDTDIHADIPDIPDTPLPKLSLIASLIAPLKICEASNYYRLHSIFSLIDCLVSFEAWVLQSPNILINIRTCIKRLSSCIRELMGRYLNRTRVKFVLSRLDTKLNIMIEDMGRTSKRQRKLGFGSKDKRDKDDKHDDDDDDNDDGRPRHGKTNPSTSMYATPAHTAKGSRASQAGPLAPAATTTPMQDDDAAPIQAEDTQRAWDDNSSGKHSSSLSTNGQACVAKLACMPKAASFSVDNKLKVDPSKTELCSIGSQPDSSSQSDVDSVPVSPVAVARYSKQSTPLSDWKLRKPQSALKRPSTVAKRAIQLDKSRMLNGDSVTDELAVPLKRDDPTADDDGHHDQLDGTNGPTPPPLEELDGIAQATQPRLERTFSDLTRALPVPPKQRKVAEIAMQKRSSDKVKTVAGKTTQAFSPVKEVRAKQRKQASSDTSPAAKRRAQRDARSKKAPKASSKRRQSFVKDASSKGDMIASQAKNERGSKVTSNTRDMVSPQRTKDGQPGNDPSFEAKPATHCEPAKKTSTPSDDKAKRSNARTKSTKTGTAKTAGVKAGKRASSPSSTKVNTPKRSKTKSTSSSPAIGSQSSQPTRSQATPTQTPKTGGKANASANKSSTSRKKKVVPIAKGKRSILHYFSAKS
eukprot:TRINITY_DN7499_c0_g1_i1.p1 TRINITY_DN7499_c0_g1~~TRINITY_DN7499_c0_g1_i1.p1  ORF type:complete len:999 (+),score=223.97 TRINITY_DN7499_c0_g1_i1:191-2998(+)